MCRSDDSQSVADTSEEAKDDSNGKKVEILCCDQVRMCRIACYRVAQDK